MADLSDVENAIVAQIASALFPNTSYSPGALATSSVTGLQTKLYRGWPLEAQLDADLVLGIQHVSVFSSPGLARFTSRWLRAHKTLDIPNATMTATVSGATVTFAGTASTTQVAGVGYGNIGYTYRMTGSDTPTTVAAAFVGHLSGATSTGPVLTLDTTLAVTATVAADALDGLITRQQEQLIRVSIWSDTPADRDVMASTVDNYIAYVRQLSFPDSSVSGPVLYRGSHVEDMPQKAHLWVRHMNYSVDYPTTLNQLLPRVIFTGGPATINGAEDVATIGTALAN